MLFGCRGRWSVQGEGAELISFLCSGALLASVCPSPAHTLGVSVRSSSFSRFFSPCRASERRHRALTKQKSPGGVRGAHTSSVLAGFKRCTPSCSFPCVNHCVITQPGAVCRSDTFPVLLLPTAGAGGCPLSPGAGDSSGRAGGSGRSPGLTAGSAHG